jgi:hypothetical protein
MATKNSTPAPGWVIKNRAGEYLWITPEGAFAWTAQPKWALQLARKQDAIMLSVADKNVGEIGRWAEIEQEAIESDGEAAADRVAKTYGREE